MADEGLLPGLTIVGLPTRNEAKTIAAVAQVADEGIAAVCAHDGRSGGTIVLADNGSTDETVERFRETALRSPSDVVLSPGSGTGKGTNVLALVHRALELGAQRLVLLDGDLRSARPDWIARLARAADGPQPRMALPVYRRNRYEATSTNQLVRPLLAAAYGSYLQQPIGGEFAFNRAFLEQVAGWPRPDSAQLYGIDVWLTANALRHGLTLAEVPLGRKLHNSPFPKILHLPQQVLDSLFHVIAETGVLRPAQPTDHQEPAVDELAVRQDAELVARINRSVRCYVEAHRADIDLLFPSARDLRQAPWGLLVTADQWPHLLADAVQALAGGELERSRDHLIALCVNRVMTYWTEIEGLDTAGVDALLHEQACATARAVAERSIVFTAPPPAPSPFHPGRWLEYQAPVGV
jgi:glycosyltransferase involved in cell wall biosynthesis